MTNILSAISGQFSKSLLLGTFLPVVVFVILGLLFVAPLVPTDWPLLSPLAALDPQWKLIVILFTMIVLSGLLYNLNIPLIRFYEGYPWQAAWIGVWRKAHYQAKFDAAQAHWRGLRTLLYAVQGQSPKDERIPGIIQKWKAAGEQVNTEFPKERASVLPTRLGNAIRSFEGYADRQYGIAAITLWPRLIAKIDKDYAAMMDDAKVSLDFMLNCSFLSGALALMILIVGLIYPAPLASPRLWTPWLIEVMIFAVLTYLFYLWAIPCAVAWGSTVKGAFDLYRWDLLKQLGYKRVPATMAEERSLWDDISLQMIYGDSPRIRWAEYALTPTYARGEPYTLDLTAARGVNLPDPSGVVKVTLQITNVSNKTAKRVVVTDTLPDGLDYEWDSASVGAAKVAVVGANPYHFEVGDLDSGQAVTLTYRAIPRKK
jgi:uncharacterized repeat protein (TIGR01451 family)